VAFHTLHTRHAREAATDMPASPDLAKSRVDAKTEFSAMKKTAEARFSTLTPVVQ
jgi:hypothetical protein